MGDERGLRWDERPGGRIDGAEAGSDFQRRQQVGAREAFQRAGESANHVTTYSYNLLNQMTQVSMTRTVGGQPVTQTRTFSYDSAGGTWWLLSETHPETGTMTYTYNADGTLATKTDAKSQQTRFTWDATYQRPTQKSVFVGSTEDICARETYAYKYWGPLDTVSWSDDSCPGKSLYEYYDYGAGNLVTTKNLHAAVLAVENASPDIGAQFNYTQEGQLSQLMYGNWNFTYSFDTIDRPSGLTDNSSGVQWVSNVAYGGTSGPAGELTALKYAAAGPGHQWYNETRTFNVRGQLTRMTATGSADTGYTTPQTVDLQYNFSGTANDGRLTSRQDLVSGEAVNYTFDTLGRLTYANNTGTPPSWTQAFTYDGFGNLLTETGSGGAPTKTLSVDPTTNRINSSGYSYDLAGNQTAMPGITSMAYDKNNRLSQATVAGGTEKHGYNPAGQRAWMLSTSGQYTVYFYGVKGELLATYHHDYGSCHCTTAVGPYVYFAGKKIWDGATLVQISFVSAAGGGGCAGG